MTTLAAILRKGTFIDRPQARSGEELYWHALLGQYVALPTVGADGDELLRKHGWKSVVSEQAPSMQFDALKALRRLWPDLHKPHPDLIAHRLNAITCKELIDLQPADDRSRMGRWLMARCKALGKDDLAGAVGEYMNATDLRAGHPWATGRGKANQFLLGAGRDSAFILSGSEATGYTLNTFITGDSAPRHRSGETIRDILTPNGEWSTADWDHYETLLTAKPVSEADFWDHPALIKFMGVRNSQVDTQTQPYWSERVRNEGARALLGNHHAALQKRFLNAIPASWLDHMADDLGLQLNTQSAYRQLTDCWMALRTSDADCATLILPAIRDANPETFAGHSDTQLLGLWRNSYQAITDHIRQTKAGQQEQLIRTTQAYSDLNPDAMREVLAAHYGAPAIDALVNAGKLHLLADHRGLPMDIRLRSSSNLSNIAGATTPDNQVYLIGNRITPQNLPGLFLHEVGEHAGLAAMLGPDYGRISKHFQKLLREKDTYATWAAMRVPASTPAANVPSEQLAYLVERVANDESARPGGEAGFALGQECLSNLRTWLFRTPICRWLDDIGALDDFILRPQDMASLAREAVDFFVEQTEPGTVTKNRNSWVDLLDPTKLDSFYRATPQDRIKALEQIGTDQAMGYLYALAMIKAPLIESAIEHFSATLAVLASGKDKPELQAVAGELLVMQQNLDTQAQLKAQLDRAGFAMWIDGTSDPEQARLHFLTPSPKNPGMWQLNHYRKDIGAYDDDQYDSVEVALDQLQPASFMVPDVEASTVLQQWAAIAGPDQQTRSQSFTRWFGASQAADPSGNALVLYHGTGQDISTFKGMTIWASTTPALASDYAEYRGTWDGGSANVMPVYMKAEHPFDADKLEKTVTLKSFFEGAAAQCNAAGRTFDADQAVTLLNHIRGCSRREESGPHYRTHDIWNQASSIFGHDGAESVKALMTLLGFDSIKITENDELTFGVFEPNQVKSAIGNRGTFSASSNDIRYKGNNLSDTPAFKSWFGTSKIVTNDGNAMVLYRGSNSDSTDFKGDRIFFADSEYAARNYGKTVTPVYLNITNPKVIDYYGNGDNEIDADIDDAREEGHDGLIVRRAFDGRLVFDQYVAFEPSQVLPALATEAEVLARQAAFESADPVAALKRWAGKTQVIEANGLPKVVFCGTGADITRFDPAMIGTGADAQKTSTGAFWFSDSSQVSEMFAGLTDNPAIMPVFLRLENPLVVDCEEWARRFDTLDQGFKFGEGRIAYSIRWFKHEAIAQARSEGRDGVMFLKGYDGSPFEGAINYAVFEPSQIKSAIGNRGTYDRASDDIRLKVSTPTETPAFKAWFDQSKIVDNNGVPLRVYHGTAADFYGFSGASYFTASPSQAADYANNQADATGGYARSIPVYLSLQNPKVVSADYIEWAGYEEAEIAKAVAEGFDGFVNEKMTEIVAFRPEQIKSAIGNNGDFDPSNSDIRYKTITLTETSNFKAWFDRSKVVDELNQPLKVFHGSEGAFTVFEPSERGTFGPGIYFADNQSSATEYGENVIQAYLSLKNPWIINVDYESDGALSEDFDSPSVEAILSLPSGRELLNAAKNGDGFYGPDLQRILSDLGHDGIIATYGDGSKELLAFRPEQVKSATLNNGNFDPNNADIRFKLSESNTDTALFKNWFNGSKVVDADGKALRVYHGTNQDFNSFDSDKIESDNGAGFFFTTNPVHASEYVEDGDSPNVMPVYLRICSPYVVSDDDWNNGVGLSPEQAKSSGFDGYLITGQADGDTYIAFHPEQIKSAISNNGDFDPANPDIRFSVFDVEQVRSYVPPHHMEAWIKSTGLPESVIQAYGKLGDEQRGEPEQAMVNAQDVMTGNPLSPVIEHVGDLTNRMSPKHNIAFAFEETRGKAENQLRTLRSKYGFARDVQESLERTANYRGIPLEELTSSVDAALERYAAAHERLEVHTEAQRLARDAAVALGRKDFEGAAQCLEALLEQIPTLEAFVAAQLPGAGSAISSNVKTNTPAFQQWFYGSKVLDDNGKPLVVYHGTDSDFTTFKTSTFGKNFTRREDSGFYFTNNAGDRYVKDSSASGYAQYVANKNGTSPNVMPVYLSIKKPLTIKEDMSEVGGAIAYADTFRSDIRRWIDFDGHDGVIIIDTSTELESLGDKHEAIYIVFEPTQIKSAIGNIGTFDPKNADIRFSFAGPSAQTANRDLLTQAQERVASGEDAEVVRRETGWFQGHDQGWRFELDDSRAVISDYWYQDGEANGFPVKRIDGYLGDHFVDLHPAAAISLGKSSAKVTGILNHPELFAAYPQLRTINVVLEQSEGYSFAENGVFRRDTVNGQPYDSILIRYNPARGGNGLSALLHEVQHAIQKVEGFARGGSTSEFQAEQLISQELSSINQRTNDLLEQNPETATVYRACVRLRIQANDAGWPEQMMANVAALEAELVELPGGEELFDLETERFGIQFIDKIALPFEKYRQLAGEVEARNVQTRLGFDAQMRLDISPLATEDVAPDQVDVRLNSNAVFAEALQQSQAERESATEAGVLDMSREARLARAEALGFDTASRWYHGTNAAGFKVFNTSGKGNTAGTGAFLASYRPMAEGYTSRNDDAPLFTGISLFNDPDQMDDLEIERFWVAETAGGRIEFEASQSQYDTAEQFLEGEGIELDSGDVVRAAYTIYFQGYELVAHATEEEAIEELDKIEAKQPGIYEVFARYGDQLVIDWKGNNWDTGPAEPVWKICDKDDDVLEYCYSQEEAEKALARHPGCSIVEDTDIPYTNTNDAAQQARDMCCDSVLIKNVYDNGPESNGDHEADVLVVFEPHNIRLTDAAFDPAQSASGNLLFSITEAPQSPAFDQWFDGSQVCNPDGTPLVVYRGDSRERPADSVFLSGVGSIGFGDFNAAQAQAIASGSVLDARRVTPAYLAIKRPLVLTPAASSIAYVELKSLVGEARSHRVLKALGLAEAPNRIDLALIMANHACVALLKAAGYDGAVYAADAGAGSVEYRVFDPAQVASGSPMPATAPAPSLATRMALTESSPGTAMFAGSAATCAQFTLEQSGVGIPGQYGYGIYLPDAAAVAQHEANHPGMTLYAGSVLTPAKIRNLRAADSTSSALRGFLSAHAKELAAGADAQPLLQSHIQSLQDRLASIEMDQAAMENGEVAALSTSHYIDLEHHVKADLGILINHMPKFQHVARPEFSASNASDYLAWSKPLNEQPAPVIEALAMIGIDGYWEVQGQQASTSFLSQIEAKAHLARITAEGVKASLVEHFPAGHPGMPTGGDVYRELCDLLGSAQAASARLHEAGVQGIRYLPSPSPAGDASERYVVFTGRIHPTGKFSSASLPAMTHQAGVDEPIYPMPLHKLPAVVLGGSLGSNSHDLLNAHRLMAGALDLKVDQLEERHHWLSDLPNADAQLLQLNKSALYQARRDLQQINRWRQPTASNCLPWTAPLGEEICSKLSTLIRVSAEEQITGEAILHLLAERMGSNKAATDALLKVGIVGAHSDNCVALWDNASRCLAQQLTDTHERNRFHLVAHGSKHLIDRFSTDKIGTGEGVQAFGYGLYFADRKLVAAHYQKMRIREGCWYERTFYDHPTDMVQSVAERLSTSEISKDLLHAARHCLSVATWAPQRVDGVIEQYPSEQHEPLREILNGYSKVSSDQLTNFFLMPKNGVRGLNEIAGCDDRDYSLGMTYLASGLHFYLREDMDDFQLSQALADHVYRQCDVGNAEEVRNDVFNDLQRTPDDTYLQSRLRDCDYYLSMAKCAKKVLEAYGPFQLERPLGTGNLYLVDLDIQNHEYLRYDLPYSEQSTSVQRSIRELIAESNLKPENQQAAIQAIAENKIGHDILGAIAGRKQYYDAGNVEDEKRASELLHEYGIQGIKYPDGLSRDGGSSTFNYVVFDDQRINILGHTDKHLRSESDEIPLYEWADTSVLENSHRLAM